MSEKLGGFGEQMPYEKSLQNREEEINKNIEALKGRLLEMKKMAKEIDDACMEAIKKEDMDMADKLYNLLDEYSEQISRAEELIEKAHQKREDEIVKFLETSWKLEDTWNDSDNK